MADSSAAPTVAPAQVASTAPGAQVATSPVQDAPDGASAAVLFKNMSADRQRAALQQFPEQIGAVTQVSPSAVPGGLPRLSVQHGPSGTTVTDVPLHSSRALEQSISSILSSQPVLSCRHSSSSMGAGCCRVMDLRIGSWFDFGVLPIRITVRVHCMGAGSARQ